MSGSNADVLVIGAAGRYTGLAIPMLAARDIRVRGFVRNTEQGVRVIDRGAAEYMIGDLRDPSSVERALVGMMGVYYIAPVYPGDESQRIGRHLVDAAARAGVRRFVFSSVIHPMIAELDNHIQKIPVEGAIVGSGMDFTILRPCHFYQTIVRTWPTIVKNGVFVEPFSAASRLSWVDYRDVAEVATIALTEDRLRNGTFDLCADAGYDRNDVARIMTEVLGHPVMPEESGVEEWLSCRPMPDDGYTKGVVIEMYNYYDRHGLVGNPLILKALLGREPRSLHQFLRDLLAGVPTIAHP